MRDHVSDLQLEWLSAAETTRFRPARGSGRCSLEDLEQVKRKDADKDGKLKIVGKDEVNESGSALARLRDTLMMRMFFELQPLR
jgi:hypothetical protein